MDKHDAAREIFLAKEKSPSQFHGSYELPNGNWQAVSSYETKDRAIEVMKFHAQGRRFIVRMIIFLLTIGNLAAQAETKVIGTDTFHASDFVVDHQEEVYFWTPECFGCDTTSILYYALQLDQNIVSTSGYVVECLNDTCFYDHNFQPIDRPDFWMREGIKIELIEDSYEEGYEVVDDFEPSVMHGFEVKGDCQVECMGKMWPVKRESLGDIAPGSKVTPEELLKIWLK